MSKDTFTSNPITRFFKPDHQRDLFQTLADTLDNPVIVVSPSDDKLLIGNRAFLLLSGYAKADLEHLSLNNLFPLEERKDLKILLAPWETSETRREEVPLRAHSGQKIQVDIESFPVGSTKTTILLILHPSLSRVREEQLRLAQEERLGAVLQMFDVVLNQPAKSLPVILGLSQKVLLASFVGLYRVSATGPDYTLDGNLPSNFPDVLQASEMGALERTDRWVLGKRAVHLLHKHARSADLQVLRTSLVGQPEAWIGVLLAGWEGEAEEVVDVDPLMQVLANLCNTTILLNQLKESLADSEQTLTNLEKEFTEQFAAVGDTLIALDEDLQVVRANPAIRKLLGYLPSEIEGLPIQDVLVGPEDITATLLDVLGHRREAERPRITLHHREGNPLPVHFQAVPLSKPTKARLMIIMKDQSEQQAIEDQAETLTQRALLGEVSAIFAHEVRNPINNITTGVQLVASRLGQDHPLYDSLEQVKQECRRLDQLMSDVLFFARPLELKMESVPLDDFLDRILNRWQPRLKQAKIITHTSYHADTSAVMIDLRTFERVIVNMISNALEAMPEGGTLSITLNPLQSSQISLVELKVADTGIGIPIDKIDRIFDPFFTTKKDGTGLGLAISRRILAAHKGTIQVESFPDAGTVFSIHLPSAGDSS